MKLNFFKKIDFIPMGSIVVLCFLYFIVLFAEFIAPYHYDHESRKQSYHPPTSIHVINQGKIVRPYIYQYESYYDEYRQKHYRANDQKIIQIQFLIPTDTYYLFNIIPLRWKLFGVNDGKLYLMGADRVGRDLFSRILYGGRISLMIGWVGAFVSFSIGLLIGGISGFYGKWIDSILMRICEVVMMIPGFYIMLALRAAFPINLSSVRVFFLIVLIMSFIGWASIARIIRGQVLSLKNRDYVLASRTFGKSSLHIIVKHILPHTMSYTLIALTMSIPGYILGESALSLLGLGIQEPFPSWGNLLSEAMNIHQITYHPWILTPGLFIFITIMSFNFMGDFLRDSWDPKLK